jgi:hypothetical protein
MPVFIRGYPGALESVLDSQAVQVLFNLAYGTVENGELYLRASLLNVATI